MNSKISFFLCLWIGQAFAQTWDNSKTIHLSNVGVINQFYNVLVHEKSIWCSSGSSLSWQTKAGTFKISRSHAFDELYPTLVGWDAMDGSQDGTISIESFAQVWRNHPQGTSQKMRGLELRFFEFLPNEVWRLNRAELEKANTAGRVSGSVFVEDRLDLSELNEAAALATLAGYNSEIILQAFSMASPKDGVQVILGVYDEGRMYAVSHSRGGQFHIHLNLSSDTSDTTVVYRVVHEYAHWVVDKLAQAAGKQEWADLILESALASEDQKMVEAANVVLDFRARYGKREFNYNLEEATDTEVFRLSGGLMDFQKASWEREFADQLGLTDQAFNTNIKQMFEGYNEVQVATYMGRWIHRGFESGVEAETLKKLDELNRNFLKNSPDAIKVYEAMIDLGGHIQRYAHNTSFKDRVKNMLPAGVVSAIYAN